MRLVVASRNEHKLRELEALLPDHELVPLPAEVELPPEAGETFAENALLKARAAAAATGDAAIADDSGIEAAALGGRPGVRSARFAGERASDADNLTKLLREVPANGDRRAAYVCAIAYVEPGAWDGGAGNGDAGGDAGNGDAGGGGAGHPGRGERVFEARCTGTLATDPRGSGGFGYDPAFVPDDLPGDRTMAELDPAEKDSISHRGRAARLLAGWLETARAAAR